MTLFNIDTKTCNQDGICAAVCPTQVIEFQKGGYPAPKVEAEEICIRCGHCVAVCPTASFSHRDMPIDQCPPVQKELLLDEAQCANFLRNRRSIRIYKKKAVPKEDLARLIEIARYAPTGHNSQPVHWLVLGNPDELRKLAGIVVDWMRWVVKNAPEIAQTLHMDRTIGRWEDGADVILRDAPVVVVAHGEKDNRAAPTSCTIAMTYLELAATAMGLGGCWGGYFIAAAGMFPPMIEALGLPEGHECFGAMMVGYPKFTYHRLPTRNTPPIAWRM